MKNLKKWTALAAVMAMTATLFTGCGSSDAPASEAAAPAAESTAAATTEAAAETPAADGELAADVQAIVDRGVLRVGVKNAVVGFGFQDTLTGEYSGLEISLAEKIAESLGVDVEFTAVTAATRTELLDSGDIDCVLATFTITDERKEAVNFSDPYYDATQAVLLPIDSEVKTEDDLKACKAIGVQGGTTGETVARGINDGAVVSVKSFNQAVLDLVNGKDDAVVIDQVPGEAFLSQYSDKIQLVEGSTFNFDVEQYGIAIPKDDEVMLNAINGALADMKADGTYDQLLEQYVNNYEAE